MKAAFRFARIDSPMDSCAFHRYAVWHAGVFVGEVFQFRASASRESVRWLAMRRDGSLRGYAWHSRNLTRKEAAEALL